MFNGMDTTFAPTMAKEPKKWTGAMVSELRKRYGLTQGDIAREVGLSSYVPVARWERKESPSNPTRMIWERLDKLERRLKRERGDDEPTAEEAK